MARLVGAIQSSVALALYFSLSKTSNLNPDSPKVGEDLDERSSEGL